MTTIRLTMAQALIRAMAAQMTEIDGHVVPYFAGMWAIFGHGNVAGLGEALYAERERLPTLRAHNEQGMVHAATAFAKASRRRRAMACTSSIGPGALNMVTGAAVAHVNRLPVLLLPGDVFANRVPDPVLQQVEDFGDGTVSANDAFRAVSRYFDRITRPEQLIPAFARAMSVLTDPAECGPVTLALCQDVQAEAFDFPMHMFAPRLHRQRRARPDEGELADAVAAIRGARRPLVISGGGVLYSGAEQALATWCADRGVPAGETQAGKSALPPSSDMTMGGIGVSGSEAANALAADADVIIAIGTRFQDFTTGSWGLFRNPDLKIVALNTQVFDSTKHAALPVVGDALVTLGELDRQLGDWRPESAWTSRARAARQAWHETSARFTGSAPSGGALPSDAQVIGAVRKASRPDDVVVCAAGGLPAELQKHWQPERPGGYHMEYGFSCMGYEIAGAIGVKMADPTREVIVMLGDGSYLMLNSEIATSVMLGQKLIIIVLDNHGYACINRLQQATGSAPFNNLWENSQNMQTFPAIDFVAHAQSLGAVAQKVSDLTSLTGAVARARAAAGTHVIVIDTDPHRTTDAGGAWWDVAVPETSTRESVSAARRSYEEKRAIQRLGN
ncbi:acetolactate synthase [Ameyamaea chiangmaiensis NBRC 103196]|uniref:3D-(3,5/4)-trihydroxycyclohexane-1,2-dione acylhydrolase (Decyclizing) n=1 Tax=Ameyamaea chiangmaiensis TaxID=442969 RepID=A0A850PDQ6_9PROT|nr:3D-(3,5/4)-trihydroxycyclohexane-1,2-dione acylhydrolase (decyclizing) [Ameyamaea chiangmaiensis]MBS4075030.1 3D-(3,5/4)-trihydroxycyclohexane-1,2-dione acylhydrolase (decyclizing) [Ameyamaea chiangmaiensis]NVN40072.1 3D-(3,5/4)-trihydroxycyclohexane-1,2-dione acylhydrolase (decyclizing) [Ameyamaea chiangmaiensis]GBQ65714.1 acetolactate synthase [Ameyamaea chiangmaiensis NBRC 103196]